MKSYVMPFVLLLCLTIDIYAQKVPTIETTIGQSLSYNESDFKKWDRFLTINQKVTELGDKEMLNKEDKLFYDKFIKDNPDIFEYEMAPWNTQPWGCSWYCGGSYETDVSSSLAPSGNNIYNKESISDGDTRTAWVEGAKGYGIGEYIEFTFGYAAPRATHCYIANGYNKNEKTWKNNSRVKAFNVYVDEKLIAMVNLKDTRDMQIFALPTPIPNRPEDFNSSNYNYDNPKPAVKLKFVITEVYKGDKYDDTAISDFSFDGIDVHCLAEGTPITMADGTTKAIEAIRKGDKVKAYNPENKTWSNIAVKQTHEATHNPIIKLTFDSGASIVATDDHPFWTVDGWASHNPQKTKQYTRYASAKITKYDVSSKICIICNDNLHEDTIKSIESISNPTKTFTLELEQEAAFVANGILVGQE